MSERDLREIASRLSSIDRSIKELVKIFDVMNKNTIAAVEAMRVRVPTEESFQLDPDQTVLPIRQWGDTTLSDKDTNGGD